ncbi:hypothetical protein FXO38_03224 [Capsicum annuum]|nr:hypothetical protein FXO38_03224 [Capsicum annuum]
MESGPSFNLGLTQIESTSNEINISGFVPGSFAYEDVGFHENRSKHRNDPTIMKKLRDATVKGKKTVVAISKGKRNEVVKRDPLPKGMKYVIKTVPHHPLRFGISFNRKFVTDVEYFVEVNESPSGTSNTITDPINEEAPREPSLIDFSEQTPPAEQNPPIVKSVCSDFYGNVVYTGDHKRDDKPSTESSHKFNFDDPAIWNKLLKFKMYRSAIKSEELLQKENLPDLILPTKNTEVPNELQEVIDNIIADKCTPITAMAVNSDDLSQKVNLPDLSLQTGNVEVSNELRESTKDSSTDASQKSIDNIIAGISTPVVSIKMKSVSPTKISDNECQIHDTQFPSHLPEAELDKMSKVAGDLNETPFDVEYVEDIAQQVSESLDSGVFVAAYAEFLSYQMQIPSSNLDAEYL